MNWVSIILLFSLVCGDSHSGVGLAAKKIRKSVKIVQEPANYGGLQAPQANSPWPKENTILRPFRKPQNFSGPRHLKKLYGSCFSLTDKSYVYQLCPFFNVTQHEQTWRWNAFHGILGIWKEWSIVNNTLEAMVMTEGDPCPGGIQRQSKIYFKCANKNKFVSVKEPSTCQYKVEFQTPLACPIDAFLVYPLLSREQQNEWEEIERSFYHKELSRQGYKKLRRSLFIRAGLVSVEQSRPKTEKKSPQDSVASSEFKTKDECSQAYSVLLHKYEQLVKLRENSTTHSTSKHSQISITPSSDLTRERGDHGTM